MSNRNKSLRELMNEFETVVSWFDNDDLDIEMTISKFDEASKLSEEIKQRLIEARNKIEIVKKKFDTSKS